jgi:hypothetical protein
MNRWAIAVGAVAGAAVLAAWALRPSVPVPQAEIEAPGPRAVFSTPAPPAPGQPPRPPVEYWIGPDGKPGPKPGAFRTPATDATAGIDPNQLFPADGKGVISAAIARRAEVVGCLESYRRRAGLADDDPGFTGRFTLEITVQPEEGQSVVSTVVMNGPEDDGLDDCVNGAMATARIAPTEHPVRVRWSVPLAVGDGQSYSQTP